MELFIIMLLTLASIPVVEFTTGPLRILLGVLFLLFFPGYTLMAALFPRKESMQGVERLALSLILSVAVVPLIGLALNYTPWGIRLEPIVAAIALVIFAASIAALLRRRGLPPEKRFELRPHITLPHWGGASRLDRALSVGLLLSIVGAIGALGYVVTAPRAEEAFTDFYVLGSEGRVEGYPQMLTLGEQAEVTLGIVNHERQYVTYNIRVMVDGETAQEIGPTGLASEEEWRERVILVPRKAGEDQKVEFLLYKGENREPYLTLHLWLNVKEKE